MMNNLRCENLKCFACDGAKCKVLSEAITDKPCPFAKTDVELQAGRQKAIDRLNTIGREDLIVQYTSNVRGYRI